MPDTSIQAFQPSDGALSAESYQTFELAKENDTVLGGDDIAQIRSYAAYARAQAQAIHKTIAATNGLDDVAAIKAEALETEQTFAKVGLYADQRIGELLRELPKSNRWSDSPTGKTDSVKESGMSPKTAYDLEKLAANPDVVELVIANAEINGTIPSRAQVLNAIREREQAKKDADVARKVADKLKAERDAAREEVAALEKQNDQLYEQAHPEPKVITREVTREVAPPDYESIKHERDVYLSDVQKMRKRNEDLRKELDKAKDLLGEKDRAHNASRDIEQLTIATNNYLRNYGGKAWAFDEFDRVDEVAQGEFRKAITSLAAFAQNLAQMISDKNRLEGSNE